MFLILDLWGQVPYRAATDGVNVFPVVLTREQAFDTIAADLSAANIANLPAIGPGNDAQILRASQAAAHMLKAKVYLNKHILLGGAPGSAPDNADMDVVISSVNAVAAAGFGLEEDYFNIFDPAPDNESVFTINRDAGSRIWNGLHYNMPFEGNSAGGWNGFCTTAEFYSIFEGDADSNCTRI